MKLHVVKFEPSGFTGEVSLAVPAGSAILAARVETHRMGEGELVCAVPDAWEPRYGETEKARLLFLFEDPATVAGGPDPAAWRHLGSWNYRSGAWQHCFAAVAKAEAKPAKVKAVPTTAP